MRREINIKRIVSKVNNRVYRVIYIKYVSAFDVTPVTGKREREIALSIGKINDEERTGLITGERVSKRKKKKKK